MKENTWRKYTWKKIHEEIHEKIHEGENSVKGGKETVWKE